MKKFIFLYFLSLSVTCFAQSNSDSVYFFNQSLNNLNIDLKNITFLNSNAIERLGSAQLFYNGYKGGYRVAQQANKSNSVGLFSEGINKFGRFSTSGYFSFTRTWQDSLAWSTKGLEQDDQPYYYGSIKAGAFERIKYDLGGNLSYNLIKNKLYIGGGSHFSYNTATRSVDPRPEVNTFNIIITPEVTYRLKNQYFGLRAKWGYGSERTSIEFKSTDYRLSTNGYPDRVNYLIMGYGLFKNNQGVSKPLLRLDKHYGLGFNYSGVIATTKLKASFDYEHREEDFYQLLDNSVNRAYAGFYDTDFLNFYLQLDQNIGNTENQLSLNYDTQNSNDINTIFYAINYRYKKNFGNFKYLIHLNKTQKISPEFGINAVYNEVSKSDYSTDHILNYSWLEPTVSAALYYLPNINDKFYAGIELGYRQPLKSNLSIGPNQENLFTYWIAYPNYSYDTSSAYKISGEFKYLTNSILKQFKTGFTAKAIYYKKDKVYNVFDNAKTNLGNNLFNFNLSLNLYF